MIKDLRKPPIGIIPKKLWDEKRFYELCLAITDRYQGGFEIPVEWIEEYNETIKKLNGD